MRQHAYRNQLIPKCSNLFEDFKTFVVRMYKKGQKVPKRSTLSFIVS